MAGRFRKAIVAAAVLSMVLFSGLWIGSHCRGIEFAPPVVGSYALYGVCQFGRATLMVAPEKDVPPSSSWRLSAREYLPDGREIARAFPWWSFHASGGWVVITAPLWFLVTASMVVLTIAVMRRFRFTVRTLLVGMTLAALLLGAITAERM